MHTCDLVIAWSSQRVLDLEVALNTCASIVPFSDDKNEPQRKAICLWQKWDLNWEILFSVVGKIVYYLTSFCMFSLVIAKASL